MTKGEMIDAVYKAKLTKRATLLVFYLINRADEEMTCFPGVKTIAKECNMSTRTVQRALNDLEEFGFIKKEIRFHVQGGQRSNLYILMISEQKINDDVVEESITFKDYVVLAKENNKDDNAVNILLKEEYFEISKKNKSTNMDELIFPNGYKLEGNQRLKIICRGG